LNITDNVFKGIIEIYASSENNLGIKFLDKIK